MSQNWLASWMLWRMGTKHEPIETEKGIARWQVEGKQAALEAVRKLIDRSAWFAVEPRPFDWYSFSVKAGEGHEVVFKS